MRAVRAVTLSVLAAAAAFGQAAPAPLEFEVASVRASPGSRPEQVALGLHMDGSQAHINALALRDYIAMAYRIRPSEITGPDWLAMERFDLDAKLPAGATSGQFPDMLQALLVDRFQLKFHREKKDFSVYALTLGKGPLKLKETPPDAAGGEPKGTVNVAAAGSAAGVSANLGNGSYYNFGKQQIRGRETLDGCLRAVAYSLRGPPYC
jgi:uncharacterized protein (TIGR03435 family)